MNQLYPLLFKPIFKDKIWGGKKLKTILNKKIKSDIVGESWELSGYGNDISVVSEGFLKGNNLEELIEIYMGDLVGDKVYDQFGLQFPLLIKFIEANEDLSIQVHPDDQLAAKRHNACGKTEMWYVLQNEPDAQLISGFNRKVDKQTYLDYLERGKLEELLNYEKVSPGDVFFIPAGRVHAIGKGILLTEIQQTSDLTYRIYDWNRKDAEGNPRQLHTEQAVEAIDYNYYKDYKTKYTFNKNKTANIIDNQYFFTNILHFNQPIEKDYILIDSFVIYICTEGSFEIHHPEGKTKVSAGDTILLPAQMKSIILFPLQESKLLEVYIK